MHKSGTAPLIIDLNANLHLRLNNLTIETNGVVIIVYNAFFDFSREHVKQLLLAEAK